MAGRALHGSQVCVSSKQEGPPEQTYLFLLRKIDQTWPVRRRTGAGCAFRRNGKARLNRNTDFYYVKLTKHGRSGAGRIRARI